MRAFLRSGASGGFVLIVAALAAMVIANSPLAPTYFAALEQELGPLSIRHWINDGLMALFFLLVGLEIKRVWSTDIWRRGRIGPCRRSRRWVA